MSSTTEAIVTVTRSEDYNDIPLAAALTLFGGTLVCVDSSGYLVDGADAAGLRFAGVLDDDVNSSDGAAGDLTGRVVTDGQALLTGSGFTAADIGKPVFLSDNQTVVLGSGLPAYYIPVGRIVQVVSATKVWVELEPAVRPGLRQFSIRMGGAAPGVYSISGAAAGFGGSDFKVVAVQSMVAYVTATKASAGMRIPTTNYTVASGGITLVTDESANTLDISFTGHLV